jgi:hypothetical protein
MASQPIFFATPKNGAGDLSAANTNRDGTGTLVDIISGGTSGTKVERVIVQAKATTTAGFVRLFLNNGTTSRLIREVPVTAATPSASVAAFRSEVDFSNPSQILVVPNGWKLQAAPHNAETFAVTAIGADA